MDPPLVNEASFSMANPSSYSLAEIWKFPINVSDELIVGGGGLGTGMRDFSGFGITISNQDISIDESTVTEQSGSQDVGGGRKCRDANSEDDSSKHVSNSHSKELLNNVSSGKRAKISGASDVNGCSKFEDEPWSRIDNKPGEQGRKSAEPPKDYIHVRARRGQATDSHSLAERARREKISDRMKVLQDLVPGCNKIIGKALVLDEIINYIQSLQNQVEFLSMKLEAVNSRMNSTTDGFPLKDLALSTVDPTAIGMIFGTQGTREYPQASEPEWLHMRLGNSFGRAG